MKHLLPSSGLPAPVSADRVRLIRRSMRCFVFGLMGAVPLLGLGMACLALLLGRQVAQETGEPVRTAGVNGCAAAFFALAAALLCFDQTSLVLALAILLSALQGYLLFREYRRTEPAQWNPARHLVWWGAGLALAGLNLSSIIILLGLWSWIRNFGS
jgi:hypothetical protein